MKLQIKSVRVKNFLSFGSREQEIEFKTGVNMVLGKDLSTGRSNGAGKSSFLETIPYALYGTTHKDVVKAQLVNWKNKRNLEVGLTFQKGDLEYVINRCVKPDNFEIWENGNLIEKPAHVRDYQKTLEDIIGLNFNTFASLIHSNINSSNRILSMKKGDKRKFIQDVFGLHLYSIMSKNAHDKMNAQQEKIKNVQTTISHHEISIMEIRKQVDELYGKISRLGSSEIDLADARIALAEALEKNPDIDNVIRDLDSKVSEKTEELSVIKQELAGVNALKDTEQQKTQDIKVKFLKLDEAEKFRKQLTTLEANRGTLENILEKITVHKEDIEKLESVLSERNKDYTAVSIEVAKIETTLDNLESKALNLAEHSECPTCGQSLEAGSSNIKKTLADEIDAMKINKTAQLNLMQSTKTAKTADEDALALSKRALNDLAASRDEIYKIKEKIKVDYVRTELDKEKAEIVGKIKSLMERLKSLNEHVTKVTTSISINQSAMMEFKSQAAVIDAKKRKIEALETQVKIEDQNKKEFQSMIAAHNIKIEEYQADILRLNKQTATFSTVIDYMNVIKELCKDENIKQYAISSIMPYLNQQTNSYLSEVGYGFYCILDRWLDADIKGPGVTNGSYGSLSGGEGRGIDLAIQFALLDIARIQAGIWPDILIMDEILDSSVDNKGIAKLMDIIKVKQSQEDNKIFLISHREELEDVEADNTYFATKDRGFTGVKII